MTVWMGSASTSQFASRSDLEPRAIHLQPGKSARHRLHRDVRMGEGHADVAQHRGIGEVALPAGHRQLLGEMPQQRVREPEVAFGILEVDRVDLVRHRRRADFAGDRPLPQVAERDVAPDVAAEVDREDVSSAATASQYSPIQSCGSICVVHGFHSRPQRRDEAFRDAEPVHVRQRGDVRVEVARRAVPLAEDRHAREPLARRGSRAATFANSLPSVVGVAVCPCVRDSIGSAAWASAKPRSAAIIASTAGSRTSSRARASSRA
jgi:hypothetical protein